MARLTRKLDTAKAKSKSILHMDSDIPSVYFPIGKPEDGGTCEFATRKCIEYCPSGQVINDHEKHALAYFKRYTAGTVFKRLIKNFESLAAIPYNARMIQWFAWGDCPSDLTGKIAEIILRIRDEGIPQYGFTRNKMLWEMIPSSDFLSMGLSIDNLKEAKEVSIESGKMTAHPDFKSGYAEMISNGKIVARCNGWWCITEVETRTSNCGKCLTEKTGCYG